MIPGQFEILATDPDGGARRGRLHTAHGPVETPVFMPVGTQATVKAMTPADLLADDCRILLGNTYHLRLRPGHEVITAAGGLHRFMAWPRAILTDSGGFQVFSLAGLRKIHPHGVEFQSHLDGSRQFLGPAEAMETQRLLGSDIAMVLDECAPYPCPRQSACQAVSRTLAWADSCRRQPRADGQLFFGIVQGSVYDDLRRDCARALVDMDFDGYAIGGLSVGEPDAALEAATAAAVAELPPDRPRYAMGVGVFTQFVEAVHRGVDMFDCVLPTRLARNGTAFTRTGRYPVKAALYRLDQDPLEPGCNCPVCGQFTRAYVRHLLNANELLGFRLLTWHNLHVYARFMDELRQAIEAGAFQAFRATVARTYERIQPDHLARQAAAPHLAAEPRAATKPDRIN